MILPFLLAVMVLSAFVLTVVATWARLHPKPISRTAAIRLLIAGLAAGLLMAYIVTAFPRRHRIYLDEDAYANMALNVGSGNPGHTTVFYLPNARQTIPFKWPVAFPVMALPFLRWMGPESGPAALNTLCGMLTVLWVMALAAALGRGYQAAVVAAILFALQPVALAWYRSGTSDPFSTLVCVGALAAAWFSQEQKDRNYWPAVSIILTGVALHARLENVILLPPVLLLLRRAPGPFPPIATNTALVLSAAALVHALRHYALVPGYYLAHIPDSSFSISLFVPNLMSNFQFVVRHAPATGLLGLAASIGGFLRLRKKGIHRAAALLLVFPLLSSALLLFYSVGTYDAPGESRFLLPVAALVSALVGAEIANLSRLRFGGPAGCAAILVLAVVSRSWPATETYLNRQWTSIAIEHDTMVQWASTLPKNALVVSRMPYFWENLGFYAHLPGLIPLRDAGNLPIYSIFGLVSEPGEWPAGKTPERRILTENGAVCLFRLN